MKKILVCIAFVPVLLTSCKRHKKDMIIGQWQAFHLQNAQMDSEMLTGQKFIDTVGTHTDAATNMQLYGVANMDSMRHIMQQQMDSMKIIQEEAIKNTVFNFRKDGMAILTFSGRTDSAKWHYDEEGNAIVLDIMQGQDDTKLDMEVAALSDTLLKLKFVENGSASTVTFHPKR
jgi:hypothetical protein